MKGIRIVLLFLLVVFVGLYLYSYGLESVTGLAIIGAFFLVVNIVVILIALSLSYLKLYANSQIFLWILTLLPLGSMVCWVYFLVRHMME